MLWTSGRVSLFPASPGVNLSESPPDSWTMSTISVDASGYPTETDVALPYGGTWSLAFSCGAIPSCCANTLALDVVADGTP